MAEGNREALDEPKDIESSSALEETEPVNPLSTTPVSAPTLSAPPDGGLLAWLQVLGASCLWFSSWGLLTSFGLFQAYYQETYLSDYAPSDISWIGTIQAFLLFVLGMLSGPLFDRGYMRALVIAGTIFVVVGLMTASVATHYYSIFLSLGVCTGIGFGCLFVPSVSVVGTYFTTKRALAGGFMAAGGSVGGVLFSVIFRPLIQAVGFGWAVRIEAFICLAVLLLALSVLKQRVHPPRARPLVDWSAFRELRFNVFSAANLIVLAAIYVPFFYLAEFAQLKIGMSESLSYHMISVLNAGSLIGRLSSGLIATKYGIYPVFCVWILMAGMLVFVWGSVTNLGGVVCFALFYGFFSGGGASLQPSAVQSLAPMHLIGTRAGMMLVFGAIGVLIGSPIAGAILDSQGGFSGVQAFAGSFLLFGSMLAFWTWEDLQRHQRLQAAQESK